VSSAEPGPLAHQGDRETLRFIAVHRLVLADHVQALLGIGEHAAGERLAVLEAAGLVRHDRALPRSLAVTGSRAPGFRPVGSDLPAPDVDVRSVRHDIGVAWLWLAASAGTLGPRETHR
jgi:hypothetical protein